MLRAPPAAAAAAAAASRRMSTAILPSADSTITPSLRPRALTDDERAILHDRLGYTFKSRTSTLLGHALTHTSYPKPVCVRGDRRIGYAFTDPSTRPSYKLFTVMGEHTEHTIRERLKSVCSPFLVNLNLSPHKLARTAIRLKLFDSLRHNSPKLDRKVKDFIKEQEGIVPYRGIPPRVPSVLPDLVRAILGAIVIDNVCQFDVARQKMRLYLEPYFLSEDLKKAETRHALDWIGKEHDLKVRFWRKRTGHIHTTKVFMKDSLHGSASSTSQSESDFLALLDAIDKLPKYMLTGTVCDTPLGIKDKLEPFWGFDHLSVTPTSLVLKACRCCCC